MENPQVQSQLQHKPEIINIQLQLSQNQRYEVRFMIKFFCECCPNPVVDTWYSKSHLAQNFGFTEQELKIIEDKAIKEQKEKDTKDAADELQRYLDFADISDFNDLPSGAFEEINFQCQSQLQQCDCEDSMESQTEDNDESYCPDRESLSLNDRIDQAFQNHSDLHNENLAISLLPILRGCHSSAHVCDSMKSHVLASKQNQFSAMVDASIQHEEEKQPHFDRRFQDKKNLEQIHLAMVSVNDLNPELDHVLGTQVMKDPVRSSKRAGRKEGAIQCTKKPKKRDNKLHRKQKDIPEKSSQQEHQDSSNQKRESSEKDKQKLVFRIEKQPRMLSSKYYCNSLHQNEHESTCPHSHQCYPLSKQELLNKGQASAADSFCATQLSTTTIQNSISTQAIAKRLRLS
ncbi:UNKNOWN [Stylonychia lemnae]|uniref:Uncharacterized protein n=1 Tax=Stylonychia lemnae TaxID=5949 RepID=A0A077ZWK7_STYLE|nr:UNKNOWN [Stylonychia lemnae]|eukprot:CDW73966.1 UNKNOWN [Stylonychia lemnae]